MPKRVERHVSDVYAGPGHGSLERVGDAIHRIGFLRPGAREDVRTALWALGQDRGDRRADGDLSWPPVLRVTEHEFRLPYLVPRQRQDLADPGARNERQ